MKTTGIGRNDPCPCGSGKKFKHCCLGSKESNTTSGHGAPGMSETSRKALEGQQFNSLEEVQAFLDQITQQKNHQPLDEFHGLSPVQMHRILDFPFTSPGLVRFPEVLDAIPAAPILTLFELLANVIGKQGLKPTAKGSLDVASGRLLLVNTRLSRCAQVIDDRRSAGVGGSPATPTLCPLPRFAGVTNTRYLLLGVNISSGSYAAPASTPPSCNEVERLEYDMRGAVPKTLATLAGQAFPVGRLFSW